MCVEAESHTDSISSLENVKDVVEVLFLSAAHFREWPVSSSGLLWGYRDSIRQLNKRTQPTTKRYRKNVGVKGRSGCDLP